MSCTDLNNRAIFPELERPPTLQGRTPQGMAPRGTPSSRDIQLQAH